MAQRLVMTAVAAGSSVLCESGVRSGRSTLVAMIAEALVDPCGAAGQLEGRRQLFVLCADRRRPHLSRLLHRHIQDSTAIVIPVDGEDEARIGVLHRGLPAMLDAAAAPIVVLLADSPSGAVDLDLACVPRLYERLGSTPLPPQFVALLSEPLTDDCRLELQQLVAGALSHSSGRCERSFLLQHLTCPYFFFRRLLRLSQGSGHFMCPTTEDGKVAVMDRMVSGHFFDEPLVTIVAATRRKAELLAEHCQRVSPACTTVAVSGRHPESIISGRSAAEAVLMSPYLADTMARRVVLCCDTSGAAALFESFRQRSHVLIVYDVPVPAALILDLERRVVDDSSGGAVVILPAARTTEALDVERATAAVHWVRVQL
jgi:hypothetical protein